MEGKGKALRSPEIQYPKVTLVAGETVLADRLAGPETMGGGLQAPEESKVLSRSKTLQIIGFS